MKNKPYPYYDLPQINDLMELLRFKAESIPDKTAFTFYKGRKDIVSKTYKEFYDDVNALGTYLMFNSFCNAHIALISENSYEYIVAFMALAISGNVAVPIDKELLSDDIVNLADKADCIAAFVSDKVYEKLIPVVKFDLFKFSSMSENIEEGRSLIESGDNCFINIEVDKERLAAIFFTSGTTGDCKGVMLSNKNMAADINYSCKNFKLDGDTLAILPFHHTFGIITAIFMVLNYEKSIFINNSLKLLSNNLQIAKPYMMFMVPAFVESFYKLILQSEKMGVSAKYLFDGNLEYIICGGAPLSIKYIKLYRERDITILNGYGITECSPVVAVNRNHHTKDGSIGLVVKGCNVKIADDNEILVSGDNVMLGYYNDEEATNKSIIDDWYHTGDLGYIDEDGFLFITGRKKNIIILSNGENISPEEIETLILNDSNVMETVVYDANGVLTAEIYPADTMFDNNEYFDKLVSEINKTLPVYKHINNVILRRTEFIKNTNKKILRDSVGGKNER